MDQHGSAEVLQVRDVPAPDLPSDGAVVEVLATSINPGEAKIREGMPGADDSFPMGEGSDLAGRVLAVGDAVEGWQVGDEVLGWSDGRNAHAQLVAVPVTQLEAPTMAVPVAGASSTSITRATSDSESPPVYP